MRKPWHSASRFAGPNAARLGATPRSGMCGCIQVGGQWFGERPLPPDKKERKKIRQKCGSPVVFPLSPRWPRICSSARGPPARLQVSSPPGSGQDYAGSRDLPTLQKFAQERGGFVRPGRRRWSFWGLSGRRGRRLPPGGDSDARTPTSAVGQKPWDTILVGAPPILVYFSGWIGMFTEGTIWILGF